MTTFNLNELDTLYRRITALELIERFKNCGLIWEQLSADSFAATYKYQDDIWDMVFLKNSQIGWYLLEFQKNGFYYVTLNSTEDTDLISFWNEMEEYNEFEKEKKLLEDLKEMRGCRDPKIYNYVPIGFGVVGAGTGIEGFQVPWKPQNIVASQQSVWDSTTEETLDVIPGYAIASLSWDVPFDDGGKPIINYFVQHSLDGYFWQNSFLAYGWNYSNGTFNAAPLTATSRWVLGLLTASNYVFRVAALNEVGLSDWAYSNNICLIAAPPANLAATQTNTGEITLSWTEQNSGPCTVVQHGIKYWQNGVSKGWLPISENPLIDTNTIITGLTTGDTYEFKVGTIIGEIIGPMSNKSNAVTLI